MKSLYIILTVLLMNVSWGQDNTTTIYLIRHAEKADASADPHLSAAGQQRAQKWAEYFAGKDVSAIYSSPYNRTRETVQPLAAASNLQVTEYNPADLYLGSLLKKYRGQAIVVVGHSNTIPAQINNILGDNKYSDMPETEYGQLYIITMVDGNITTKVEKI